MMMFFFRPHGHWNVISEKQYAVLSKFYDSDKLEAQWVEKE